VNLKKDAADYGADGMACHRDACLILTAKSMSRSVGSASQRVSKKDKIN